MAFEAADAGAAPATRSRHALARTLLDDHAAALTALDAGAVEAVARLIHDCVLTNRQLMLLGNGGSCATASHLATDLTIAARAAGLPARVVALHDNSALVTALSNDIGFAESGTVLVEATASPGDVLLIFSGSGRSPNLVAAARAAADRGVACVLIGSSAAPDAFPAAHRLLVPSDSYSVIETAHAALCHVFADLFREKVGVAGALCSQWPPRPALR
ncbi:MAG TPA: SIS domain-containing protein [Actinomycetota bacterium]|nr:SIS domain-containing protein [Actinomycetota bacterium]